MEKKEWLKRRLLIGLEAACFGGRRTESALIRALGWHYKSRFRRDWKWSTKYPKFSGSRIGAYNFGLGLNIAGAYPMFRGFYSAEVIRDGDNVLDISCGDGFFARRFFCAKAAHVDAIDINEEALSQAKAHNAGPNISYHLVDAVVQPFPRSQYDVIVWDAAIKYFPANSIDDMVLKIRNAMPDHGIFVGSVPLGEEGGHEHNVFYSDMSDLDALFRSSFRFRKFRVIDYKIGPQSWRREAYWRCSNDESRIENLSWQMNS